VLKGDMNPTEAYAKYGRKEAGTPGRARKFADFNAYLHEMIGQALDPDRHTALLAKLQEKPKAGETVQKAAARTRSINLELERTGQEHADVLRGMLDHIEQATPSELLGDGKIVRKGKVETIDAPDAAGKTSEGAAGEAVASRPAAVERWVSQRLADPENTQTETELRAAVAKLSSKKLMSPDEFQAMQDRMTASMLKRDQAVQRNTVPTSQTRAAAATLADPQVNRGLDAAMRGAEAEGRSLTLHDALSAAMTDRLRTQAPAAFTYARQLRDRLLSHNADLPVMSEAQAHTEGLAVPDNALGAFMRDEDGAASHIVVNDGSVQTLLHEATHAVGANYIDWLGERAQANHPDRRMLDAIGREVGIPDRQELHAEILSNPELQADLASRKPSATFLRETGTTEAPRTLWQAFTGWVRRSLGFEGPGSATERSLLDHVLRPLHDINERASGYNEAAYNRQVADPQLREKAAPLLRALDSSNSKARDFADTVIEKGLRKLDPAKRSDEFERAALIASPTDSIVNFNRGEFKPSDRLAFKHNPLVAFRDAQENIGAVARAFYARHSNEVDALVTRLSSGEGRDKVAPLMNEATLADVQLGARADNSHLKTPEQQAALSEVQAKYKALTPEGRDTYDRARDLYARMHAEERREQLGALVRGAMPDATPDQVQAIGDALKSKGATEAFIRTGDSDALARAFGTEWETNRGLVRRVAAVHDIGRVQGDYFPLRRMGDYVVRYGSAENGDYGMETFESRREANARHAELKAANVDDLSLDTKRALSENRQVMPGSAAVDALERAMVGKPGLAEHSGEVRNLLNEILLRNAARTESARTKLRRKGVQGANVDAARIMAHEYVAGGSRMGYLAHGADRHTALRQMTMVAEDLARHGGLGQSIRARSVINELRQRIATPEQADGLLAGAARKASVFGYTQNLMSVANTMISSLENHVSGVAHIGARHGNVQATLALAKASREITPQLLRQGAAMTIKAMGKGLRAADWNLAHYARDQLIRAGANKENMHDLFARLERTGMIEQTELRDMRTMAAGGGASTVGRVWNRYMDFMSAGHNAVEVASRSAIAKAAYDLERRKGGSHEQAANYAIETLRKAAPNFSQGNKARIATKAGPLGWAAGPITQFKNFGLHQYGVLINLARDGIRSSDPEVRRESRRAFAGVMVSHALMAGGMTWLADPLRYIGGAYDAIFNTSPHNYQDNVRGWISDVFGKNLGEVLARGLPHLAGIDLHRRSGIDDVLGIPPLESFDSKGLVKMIGTAVLGASGRSAGNTMQGAIKLIHGDVAGGIHDMVPRMFRDPMDAAAFGAKGVTDSQGKTTLPASQISAATVIAKGLGFQPSQITEFREGREADRSKLFETRAERNQLAQQWMSAKPADRAALMPKLREFNQANPGAQLTVDQLLKMQQSARKDQASPGTFGLRLPTKGRSEFTAPGRFANVS
jgi:hypothetical protein